MKSTSDVFITLLVLTLAKDGGTTLKGMSQVDRDSKSAAEGSTAEEVSNENIFSALSSLQAFHFQLAGHMQELKVGKRIGLMVDSNGDLLKPKPLDREIDFYSNLRTTQDSVLREMNKYVPAYLGVKYVDYGGEVVRMLHIENVLKDYKKVCSMDVKIGIQRRPAGWPVRPDKKQTRYRKMKEEYGFAIPGFIYYDVRDEATVCRGRELGHFMEPRQGIETLYNFVNRETGIRCGVVENILRQLRKIHSCFQQQRTYRFFDSSILITYDAESVRPCSENMESEEDVSRPGLTSSRITVNVRVIDFGKAVPITDVDFNITNGDAPDKEDSNFVVGVRRLISVFENLPALYAAPAPDFRGNEVWTEVDENQPYHKEYKWFDRRCTLPIPPVVLV